MMNTYEVPTKRTVVESTIVEVEAKSEAAAKEKALDAFQRIAPRDCKTEDVLNRTAEEPVQITPYEEDPSGPEQLSEKYGFWGEHPDYTAADWSREASANSTRLGYWEWVAKKIQVAE